MGFDQVIFSAGMESSPMHTPQPLSRDTRTSIHRWSLWTICFLAGCAIVSALGLSGCSGGGAGGGSTQAKSGGTEPARAAVVEFLAAIKRGDDAAASGMLTKVARAKTEELGLTVAPPVNDSATYEVKECEMVGDAGDLVHVGTTWSDKDEEGTSSTESIVWVVRLDPEGWRVVGMAMRVFEDMPPLLLNFEDPEDMIAKQEMVAAELQRRSQTPTSTPGAGTAQGQDQSQGQNQDQGQAAGLQAPPAQPAPNQPTPNQPVSTALQPGADRRR